MPKIIQDNGLLFVTEKEKNIAAIISMPFLNETRIEHKDIKSLPFVGARMLIISALKANVHEFVLPFIKIGYSGNISYHSLEVGMFEGFFSKVVGVLININKTITAKYGMLLGENCYRTVAALWPANTIDSYYYDKKLIKGHYEEFVFRGQRVYRTSVKKEGG